MNRDALHAEFELLLADLRCVPNVTEEMVAFTKPGEFLDDLFYFFYENVLPESSAHSYDGMRYALGSALVELGFAWDPASLLLVHQKYNVTVALDRLEEFFSDGDEDEFDTVFSCLSTIRERLKKERFHELNGLKRSHPR